MRLVSFSFLPAKPLAPFRFEEDMLSSLNNLKHVATDKKRGPCAVFQERNVGRLDSKISFLDGLRLPAHGLLFIFSRRWPTVRVITYPFSIIFRSFHTTSSEHARNVLNANDMMTSQR